MIPKTLKDFNVFFEQGSWLGIANEIELPKLTKKSEEINMGNGPLKMQLGNEAMESIITLDGLSEDVLATFGECDVAGVALRFAGAFERQDSTCETSSMQIVMRGRLDEIDLGTAKKGDLNQAKYKMALSYLKIVVDDNDVIEVDLANYIERVGGVDRLARVRAAIGL